MNHHTDCGARGVLKLPVQVLRLCDLVEMTKLSRSTLYGLMKAGAFPAGFLLAPRARGWLAADVVEWIEARRAKVIQA